MNSTKKNKQESEWDEYWKANKKSPRRLYDIIASFYRRFLIKRSLNHFIFKYLKQGSSLLHAGCGSGQVDVDLKEKFNITALDISENALIQYKCFNGENSNVVQGNIFSMPFENKSFDGIYNLGVMEHFKEEEIRDIFKEFNRVLKQNGLMVIFWPPEYGLSVVFFKVLTFIYKNIFLKKQVKFHPDEIKRIRSKKHAYSYMKISGFVPVSYSFGPRDLFTYSVLIAKKADE